jgi:hypothetical protein
MSHLSTICFIVSQKLGNVNSTIHLCLLTWKSKQSKSPKTPQIFSGKRTVYFLFIILLYLVCIVKYYLMIVSASGIYANVTYRISNITSIVDNVYRRHTRLSI